MKELTAEIENLVKHRAAYSNGVIHLGYQNGWGALTAEVYRTLKQKYKVEGSEKSQEISNCVTEYSCTLKDGDNEYTLVSIVDSGD